jgi:hypothetical protein
MSHDNVGLGEFSTLVFSGRVDELAWKQRTCFGLEFCKPYCKNIFTCSPPCLRTIFDIAWHVIPLYGKKIYIYDYDVRAFQCRSGLQDPLLK